MTERTGVLTVNPLSREPLARRLGRPRDTRSRVGKTPSSPMATIQDGCDRRNREAGKLERMALHGAGQAVASALPRRARARGHGVRQEGRRATGLAKRTAGPVAGHYVPRRGGEDDRGGVGARRDGGATPPAGTALLRWADVHVSNIA